MKFGIIFKKKFKKVKKLYPLCGLSISFPSYFKQHEPSNRKKLWVAEDKVGRDYINFPEEGVYAGKC